MPEVVPNKSAPLSDTQPADWRKVRLWQIQPVRDLLVIAFLVGLVYLGYLLSSVTVPLLLALGLAYLVEPIVSRVTRSGRIRRPVAAAGVIVISALVVVVPVVVGSGFAVAQGARVADSLGRNFTRFNASVSAPNDEALRERLPQGAWRKSRDFIVDLQKRHPELAAGRIAGSKEGGGDEQTDAATNSGASPVPPATSVAGGDDDREPTTAERWADFAYDWVQTNAPAVRRWFTGNIVGSGRDAFGVLWGALLSLFYLGFMLFLTLFFFFFMCSAWGGVKKQLASLVPEKNKDRVLDIVGKMDRVIAAFIRGRLLISAILSLLLTIGFWFIGAPAPLVLGLLIGVLSLVPYLALLGVPVVVILMWLNPSDVEWQSTWWWVVFAPCVLYWIVQATDDYIWTPLIQGKATGMDTPTILFAVLAGASLAGFYGVMVAIPAAACVKILLKEVFWPRFEAWAKGQSRDFLPISRG
jgi:predicted PurR-regulated permease PerM